MTVGLKTFTLTYAVTPEVFPGRAGERGETEYENELKSDLSC